MSEALRGRRSRRSEPVRGGVAQLRLLPPPHARGARRDARASWSAPSQESPGHADCSAMLSIMYGGRVQPRVQRAARSARPCPGGGPASGRSRPVQPHGPLRPGLVTVLPARDPELPKRGGAGPRAESHGRRQLRVPRHADGLRGRMGARLRAGRAGHAAESQPSWVVLVHCLLQRLPKGDYPAALDTARKLNMPGYFIATAALAAPYGQLGERDAAASALRELLRQRPDIATVAYRGIRQVVRAGARRASHRRPAQGGAGRASAHVGRRRRRPGHQAASPRHRCRRRRRAGRGRRDRGAAVLGHEPREGPGSTSARAWPRRS